MYDDLALGHRNGDLVLFEQPPYGAVHLRTDIVHAFLRIGNPETQLEFDSAVAEVHEPRHRRRLLEDTRLVLAGIEQDLQGQLRIVAVAYANGQLQTDARIGIAPVDHRIGDELL